MVYVLRGLPSWAHARWSLNLSKKLPPKESLILRDKGHSGKEGPAGLGQCPQVPQGDINLSWSSDPGQNQWLEDREPLQCLDQGTAYCFQSRQWR